jgi:hypothetical protein
LPDTKTYSYYPGIPGLPKLKPPAECRWRSFLGSDYERSDYQSFGLPSSCRYVGSIAFRDQLDWIGAAWVLAGTGFRRSAVSAIPAPIRTKASVALKLPGAMQLMQVPMIAGASNMVPSSFAYL